jgi:hypothetical protein
MCADLKRSASSGIGRSLAANHDIGWQLRQAPNCPSAADMPVTMFCVILLRLDLPDGHLHRPDHLREKSNFSCRFKLIWAVQCVPLKFCTFLIPEIDVYSRRHGPKEGRIANVTYVGPVMRWTRMRCT